MALARRPIGISPLGAALLIVAALLMRLLVPAGFMPDFSRGDVRIMPCTGVGPAPMAAMHMDMGDAGHGKSAPGHRDRGDSPCGFGGLAAPGLAGADPIQLALALVFILAAVPFARSATGTFHGTRLRPPLRAPPAI